MSEEKQKPDQADEGKPTEVSPEDPLSLYRDHVFTGPPATRYERFRRFAVRNRRVVYTALLLTIVGSFTVMMMDRQPESVEHMLKGYFARFAGRDEGAAYSVGAYNIGQSHLKKMWPVLGRITWGEAGAKEAAKDETLYGDFVRDQFETDLLVNAALKEGVLSTPEARVALENAVRHAAAEYYLFSRLAVPGSNFRINVPREEILAVYEKNREIYTRQGIDKAAALPMIERTLSGLKRDELNLSLARVRAQILAQLKDRGGYTYTGPTGK